MRVTFGWVLLAQKTLCNGTINIVSKVSLNFGCLFLRNNTVLLDGRHGCWWRDEYVVIIFQFFLNINSIPLHEMKLHKMTKELALRPQYAQYPNPNPKPELFGQTRPEVKKPYSSRPDSDSPGRGKWSKCGIFLIFFEALLWPNGSSFSTFVNCSEEILSVRC